MGQIYVHNCLWGQNICDFRCLIVEYINVDHLTDPLIEVISICMVTYIPEYATHVSLKGTLTLHMLLIQNTHKVNSNYCQFIYLLNA